MLKTFKKLSNLIIISSFIFSVTFVDAHAAYLSQYNEEGAMMNVAKQSVASVVSVYVSQQPSSTPINQRKFIYGGTGFIVSSNGYILTSNHVVDFPGVNYTVILNNKRSFDGTMVFQDKANDLAVLKINDNHLPALALSSSSELGLGQTVLTIGNELPPQFPNSVTDGVVSGLDRDLKAHIAKIENGKVIEDPKNIEELHDLIQVKAQLNSGNSGGPLLDLNGKVVGIVEANIPQAPGMGFAMPSEKATQILKTLQSRGIKLDLP